MQRARRPPKLAGIFQPCAATTLAASKNIPPSVGYRQPSPTVHKKSPPPPSGIPAYASLHTYERIRLGAALGVWDLLVFPTRKHLHPSYAANGVRRGLPHAKGPSPSPPNRASAPGHSRIHGEKGRIPQAPPPSRRRTEAIRRGYRTSRNSLKTTSFLAM